MNLVYDTAKNLEDLPNTLGTLVQTLHGNSGHQPVNPLQHADLVKTEAAKVGLACADGQPAEPELHALLAALQQAVTGLCLSLHSLMGDAGPSLRQDLELMIKAFAERNASLVRTIPKPTELPRAVGNVWDVCSAARLPLSNKSALFKRMGGSLRAINDTMREMAEIQQHAPVSTADQGESTADPGSAAGSESGVCSPQAPLPATNGHAHANGLLCSEDTSNGPHAGEEACEQEEDRSSSVCDYETGPVSARDRDVAASGHALMSVAADALKLLSRQLLQGPNDLMGSSLEAWENCIWHAKNLRSNVEDLGAAMFPPQDLDEIEDATEGVVVSVTCLLEEIPEENNHASAEEVLGLQSNLEGAELRLRAAIVDSRNDQ